MSDEGASVSGDAVATRPEIVIGLVGALGTEMNRVEGAIEGIDVGRLLEKDRSSK